MTIVPAQSDSRIPVTIVGGGLAGIAAASALSSGPFDVTLLESRPQLGGRATSYVDRETGETIDNCQHVSMGCCTNLRHLCQRLGLQDAFQTESTLYFVAPDRTVTRFAADPLPAPFHLTRSFLRLPYLSWKEKRLFAKGVQALARARAEDLTGRNFSEWLETHGQTESLKKQVWEVVLVSALSESLNRIDAAYAQKVFVDGFLAHAHGWNVEIPRIDLDELYSQRARPALEQQGVRIRTESRVTGLTFTERDVTLQLSQAEPLTAQKVILAVPHHQVCSLLPDQEPFQDLRNRCEQLESAPITSIHLWYDRPLMSLPHAVLVGRLGHWVFARGERTLRGKPAWYYQVVISASRMLKEWTQAEVTDRIHRELQGIWDEQGSSSLRHSRLITERRAVFSAVPGVDALRPDQQTPHPSLLIAGDWTQTGWPATMEGAVISGYRAAESLSQQLGLTLNSVQPGLPVSVFSRWLLGVKSR